jgi:23S rRNA (adenine2030-N6)-methyltransferase
MNYRHAFHAGNFADVVKHAVLARILVHLCRKETPFRVLDTHAGSGIYDLGGSQAERTGEWRGGIGRVLGATLPDEAAALLAPYLEAIAALRGESGGDLYPGSPEIARRLTRRQDRLILTEKHPVDAASLAEAMAADRRVKVLQQDAWTALKAHLPPRERRGLIIVDPPFEHPDEFSRMEDGLREALARFSTGIYALWYPIKDPAIPAEFAAALAQLAEPREAVTIELFVKAPADPRQLNGCGMAIVNPPWTLADECGVMLDALVPVLRQGAGAMCRIKSLRN